MSNPNPKIDHLQNFADHPENINRNGRPKSIMKQVEQAVGLQFGLDLTKDDKYRLIEWALERNKEELGNIIADDKSPVFLVTIGTAILHDIIQKRITTVEAIFDRVFGKPSQSVHHLGKDGEGIELIVTYADKD